jgi:hypothetical protein
LARMGVPARLVGENCRVYTIGSWPAEHGRTQIPAAPQTGSRPVDLERPPTSEPQDQA